MRRKMRCPNCKKLLREGAKFCPTCGININSFHKKKKHHPIIVLILVLVVLSILPVGFLIGMTVGGFVLSESNKSNSFDTAAALDELRNIDFKEMVLSNAQILEILESQDAMPYQSEENVALLFSQRGFDPNMVTYAYSTDGTFSPDSTIDVNSAEGHPTYTGYYLSSDEYLWTIQYCNESFYALPVSYRLSSNAECEIIVSETEYITAYDVDENSFYQYVPDKSACEIITISYINADALDKLAEKELSIS